MTQIDRRTPPRYLYDAHRVLDPESIRNLVGTKQASVSVVCPFGLFEMQERVSRETRDSLEPKVVMKFTPWKARERSRLRTHQIILKTIRKRLLRRLDSLLGISLEENAFSLTFSYRAAGIQKEERIRRAFWQACRDPLEARLIDVIRGKKFFKVVPRGLVNRKTLKEHLRQTLKNEKAAVYENYRASRD